MGPSLRVAVQRTRFKAKHFIEAERAKMTQSGWLKAAATAIALFLPSMTAAQGVAGDYLAARQAGIMGDFEQAARYFDRALMFDPDNVEFMDRAALSYLSLGDVERAAVLGNRILESGQTSQVAQMAVMAERLGNDDYAGAIDMIAQSRGVGPLVDGLIKAWSELGQGDMSAALVAFEEVGNTQGLEPFEAYHKALALASVGDYEGAEKIFATEMAGGLQFTRRAVIARLSILSQLERHQDALDFLNESFNAQMDPELRSVKAALEAGETLPFTVVRSAKDGLAESFFSLAEALANDASDDFTLLYARIAEHLRSDHFEAALMTAELLERLGQYDLAVDAYRDVQRDDPGFHAAELGRAGALRAAGRTDAAVEVLESLAETHGDLPLVQSTLADLKRSLNEYDDAIEAYTKAIDLFDEPERSQWFLFYARGISNERSGNWEAAEADFRTALELNPDQPQVLNYLGYSLVEKQTKLDEALDMIERAVAAEPGSGYIVDSLGWVQFKLGRYAEAVENLERAAELMPIDPVVNDHLGDSYWAVGRKTEAQFMWRRALSFVDYENVSEDADADRIRRKLEVGLDQLLEEEGADPLTMETDDKN